MERLEKYILATPIYRYRNLDWSWSHYLRKVSWVGRDYRGHSAPSLNTTGLNPEFSFSLSNYHNKVRESSLSYYLAIVEGSRVGFIPFQRVLARCEIQTDSFRIVIRIAESTSYDDNRYATSASLSSIIYALSSDHAFL